MSTPGPGGPRGGPSPPPWWPVGADYGTKVHENILHIDVLYPATLVKLKLFPNCKY